MSAIAGILYFDSNNIHPDHIKSLVTGMIARGPDNQGWSIHGVMAMGCCQLRTTPESLQEIQPVLSEDKNLVLVSDCRLDNREELQGKLTGKGVNLRNSSDAELLLQSYACWGEHCTNHLLGNFAFAVWDNHKQLLFCARDHVGGRPLYYTINDQFFAFASENEALLTLPGVSRRPNEDLLANYLLHEPLIISEERSWLYDVFQLIAGNSVTITPNKKRTINTYWEPEPLTELRFNSDRECEEAFLDVLGKSIQCRLRSSSHQHATMISGGIDSASTLKGLTLALSSFPGEDIHTYSTISDDENICIESQSIRLITNNPRIHAHTLSVPSFTGILDFGDLQKIAWEKVHPVDNSILLPAMMCRAAQKNSHKILHYGAAGDITMYVPPRYLAYWLKQHQWGLAWRESTAASRNSTLLHGQSPLLIFLLNNWDAFIPATIRHWAKRFLKPENRLHDKYINPDFMDKLRVKERLLEQTCDRYRVFSGDLQENFIKLLGTRGDILGIMGMDKISGHYGIESRDPWTDKRMLEFFQALPLHFKIRDGWTKHLARTALLPDLPLVQRRTGKEHLGWLFANRLMRESRDFVISSLENGCRNYSFYLEQDTIHASLNEYKSGRSSSMDMEYLYEILVLVRYLDRISEITP